MSVHKDQDRIEKVVELAAPVARVWQAITNHEEFGEWFRVRLDGPFEVGATSTGKMTYPGYEHVEWVSTTEVIEPGRLFVFSWPPSAVDPDTAYGDDARSERARLFRRTVAGYRRWRELIVESELRMALKRAARHHELCAENSRLRDAVEGNGAPGGIIGAKYFFCN